MPGLMAVVHGERLTAWRISAQRAAAMLGRIERVELFGGNAVNLRLLRAPRGLLTAVP